MEIAMNVFAATVVMMGFIVSSAHAAYNGNNQGIEWGC